MGRQSGWLVRMLVIAVLLAAAGARTTARAAVLAWAEGLVPGPYQVGFLVTEHFDYRRTFRSGTDYFGEPVEGDVERPVQIYTWYPARDSALGPRMVYGEYNFAYPADVRLLEFLSALQDREIGLLHRLVRGDRGLVLDLLSVEVSARRSAATANGTFPLVLYAPDGGHGMAENAALCEYLASHGFVVAGMHQAGDRSLGPAVSQEDIAAQIGDLQFALALLVQNDGIDTRKVGVLGAGTGAASATLLAMMDTRIQAVGLLGGWPDNRRDLLTGHPSFDPLALRAPALQVHGDTALLKTQLEYAERYLVQLNKETSTGFNHYDLIASLRADTTGDATRSAEARHNTVCELVASFLGAHLSGDDSARAELTAMKENAIVSRIEHVMAHDAPPTPAQFSTIMETRGVGPAAEIFDRFEMAKQRPPILPENQLNAMGYQLLGRRRVDDAVQVFRMCAESYPHSANVWDSYGEALLAAGDTAAALLSYRRLLEAVPGDSTADAATLQAIKQNAEAIIPRLREAVEQ